MSPGLSKSPTWSTWAGGLLGASRPTSPAPTFGAVMTDPKLRHSSSLSHMQLSRAPSTETNDPFASLGLRISMPAHIIPLSNRLSPNRPSPNQPRPRTTSASAMYTLGLGARGSTFGMSRTSSLSSPVSRLALDSSTADEDEELDEDIE